MKQKEKIEMFKQFLKDNDCYKKFKIELATQRKIKINQYFKKISFARNYVFYAFNWRVTKQGRHHWNNIDKKWRDLLNATR